MSKHYSPEADDQMPEKKTSQNRLLLLLLLLVALFAYLYFFTGLIKPREEQVAQAPAPEAAPTDVVKQPLPPRPEAGAQPGAAEGEPAAGAKAETPVQPATPSAAAPEGAKADKPAAAPEGAKAGKPAAAPEGAKAGKSAAPAEAKPAKPAAPQTAQKQAAPEVKPAAKPATAAKATPAKPAATAAAAKQEKGKPAPAKDAKTAAATKPQAANGAQKGATADSKKGAAAKAAATAPGKAKTAAGTAAGAYALEINDDLVEGEIKSVTAKLKQAGVAPVVKTTAQKGEPVHRLYLADFGNRDEALEELERLKLAAPNAFMLKENGRYTVYAGSFVREGRAAVEQDRLYEKGVKLLLKTGTATVPVVRLRAGSFADQAKAEKAAQSLKQKGIAAKVVKVGR